MPPKAASEVAVAALVLFVVPELLLDEELQPAANAAMPMTAMTATSDLLLGTCFPSVP
jgi:hypothetical protein